METHNPHLRIAEWYLLTISMFLSIWMYNTAGATNDVQSTSIPAILLKAAKEFRSAPPTNRLTEAEQVWRELPKCPLTFQKDIGTGVLRSYDYSKPSYVLSREDVEKLLGQPILATTNEGAWTAYSYLIKGLGT